MFLFAFIGLAAGCAKEEVRGTGSEIGDNFAERTIETRTPWECDCVVYFQGGNEIQGASTSSGSIVPPNPNPFSLNDFITLTATSQSPSEDAFGIIRILCTSGEGDTQEVCLDNTCTLMFNKGTVDGPNSTFKPSDLLNCNTTNGFNN